MVTQLLSTETRSYLLACCRDQLLEEAWDMWDSDDLVERADGFLLMLRLHEVHRDVFTADLEVSDG